jgi:hypothetical protein
MSKDISGPAFPGVVRAEYGTVYDGPGMSIRDYFAGQAMAGILASYSSHVMGPEFVSSWAYKHADAMLKEREK